MSFSEQPDDEAVEAQCVGRTRRLRRNSTIIVGQTSVIVVDAKQTDAGAKDLLAEIAKITPKPVKTVILTHSDGDHVNGLVAYPTGIEIIAHENNKKELQTAIDSGARGALSKDRLPTRVTTKEKRSGDDRRRQARAVSLCSGTHQRRPMVYLPNEKIVSTGDIIVTNARTTIPMCILRRTGERTGGSQLLRLDQAQCRYVRYRPWRSGDQSGLSESSMQQRHGVTRLPQ